MEAAYTKAYEHEKYVTCRIFRTAYKVAKKNQAFNDFESEIDVQEMNGCDMGRILHSTNACINIVKHIGTEMKKTLIKKIIALDCKISLLIDESSTISQLSTLIIYVLTMLPDMKEPTNLFIDILELENVSVLGIFKCLINVLNELGFNNDFFEKKSYCYCL